MSSAVECNLYRSIQAILREVDCPIQGVSTCNRGEVIDSKIVYFTLQSLNYYASLSNQIAVFTERYFCLASSPV